MLILYTDFFFDDFIGICMRYPRLKIMSVFNITLMKYAMESLKIVHYDTGVEYSILYQKSLKIMSKLRFLSRSGINLFKSKYT